MKKETKGSNNHEENHTNEEAEVPDIMLQQSFVGYIRLQL